MLNKKIIGLFVLGLALSSPLQNANAASASPGAPVGEDFTCYEPTKCKRGYSSKGNIRGEQNIGSGGCWCVYSGEMLEAMRGLDPSLITTAYKISQAKKTIIKELASKRPEK